MIDPNTGLLTFDEPPVRIGPGLTRSEFLGAGWDHNARELAANEPWHSWSLNGRYRSGPMLFAVALYFHGDQLVVIEFRRSGEESGSSWAASPEEEQKGLDAWLRACLGGVRSFPWGKVWSVIDPEEGGSSIVISYDAVSFWLQWPQGVSYYNLQNGFSLTVPTKSGPGALWSGLLSGVFFIVGLYATSIQVISAASLIIIVVVSLLLFLLNRYFVKGKVEVKRNGDVCSIYTGFGFLSSTRRFSWSGLWALQEVSGSFGSKAIEASGPGVPSQRLCFGRHLSPERRAFLLWALKRWKAEPKTDPAAEAACPHLGPIERKLEALGVLREDRNVPGSDSALRSIPTGGGWYNVVFSDPGLLHKQLKLPAFVKYSEDLHPHSYWNYSLWSCNACHCVMWSPPSDDPDPPRLSVEGRLIAGPGRPPRGPSTRQS